MHHAVVNAFEGLLAKDTHPFYVLFIEIDPKRIDVNVHPTKTEIKFDDDRTIYGIMNAAVRQALGAHNVAPALDFESDINFSFSTPRRPANDGFSQKQSNYQKFKGNTGNENAEWNKILDDFQSLSKKISEEESQSSTSSQQALTFGSAINDSLPKKAVAQDEEISAKRSLFQIHNKFIASQVKSGMMLVNQHAAHERILYEKFMLNLADHKGSSQQFLFPEQIQLSPADYALVFEMEKELHDLGFVISSFGKDTVVINGAPTDLTDSAVRPVFEGLIEQYKHNQHNLSISKTENIARSLAKKSAIKTGASLSKEEMNAIIDKLFACSNPNYTPSGSPTFVIFDLDKLSSFFN